MSSRWNDQHHQSEHGYPYYYDDAYYDHQGEIPASGPSSYRAPPPSSKSKRRQDVNPAHSSTSGARPDTPPRKTARFESTASASDTRRTSTMEANSRNDEGIVGGRHDFRLPNTRLTRPETTITVTSIVDALKKFQDVRKRTWDAETNSSKYERFRGRDDISRENKAKADEALKEVTTCKEQEKKASRSVVTKLQLMLDTVFEHSRQFDVVLREDISREIGRERSRNADFVQQNDFRTTIPLSPSSAQVPGSPTHRPLPNVNGDAVEPSVSSLNSQNSSPRVAVNKGKKRDNSDDKKSPMKRLEELEQAVQDSQMDSEERLNQIEALIREMVQEEVENRIRDARTRRGNRADGRVGKSNATQTPNSGIQARNEAMSLKNRVEIPVGVEGGEIEEGEILPQISASQLPSPQFAVSNGVTAMSDKNNSSATNTAPSIPNTNPRPLPPKSVSPGTEDADPPMSREQVNATIQSLREEFDTKLFAQEKQHRQQMENLTRHWQVRIHGMEDKSNQAHQNHQDILKNHADLLQRHQTFWQGTLGLLSNIPRPTNTLAGPTTMSRSSN